MEFVTDSYVRMLYGLEWNLLLENTSDCELTKCWLHFLYQLVWRMQRYAPRPESKNRWGLNGV
jgi:hypothetical protein